MSIVENQTQKIDFTTIESIENKESRFARFEDIAQSLSETGDYVPENKKQADETCELEAEIREAATEMWAQVDTDGDGTINFEEFLKFASTEKQSVDMESLRDTFRQIDRNSNGHISLEDYVQFKLDLEK